MTKNEKIFTLLFIFLLLVSVLARMTVFESRRAKILARAAELDGTPYVYGETDCSWFVGECFRAANIDLPRMSKDQERYIVIRKFYQWEFFLLGFIHEPTQHSYIKAGNGLAWHASSSRGVETIKVEYLKGE